jgi:single stranded DNA-binding protein (ssb)
VREAQTFISCVIWRKSAENFCNFTSKGSLVGVDGRIQTRSYDNKDGQRVYVTEVVVDNFALLESRKDREARGQNGGYTPNNGNNSTPSTNNFQNNGGSQNNNPQIITIKIMHKIHSLDQVIRLIFLMMIFHSKNKFKKGF